MEGGKKNKNTKKKEASKQTITNKLAPSPLEGRRLLTRYKNPPSHTDPKTHNPSQINMPLDFTRTDTQTITSWPGLAIGPALRLSPLCSLMLPLMLKTKRVSALTPDPELAPQTSGAGKGSGSETHKNRCCNK
ncbi:hypothetical protein E2C01_094509 [Portunus trituberculatus]|uniref:Uncharacterized protein n=1 Tax=Portunus trituberculatus TaxID=210409 RepID=A0A5B7JXD2_PORTR|nr:hypothetical protein [Portunus trituberculatus]